MPEQFPGLETALESWRDWGLGLDARPAVIGPVEGGRTNRSFQLHAPGLSYDLLLRLNNPRGHRLGIDRGQEAAILEVVASAELTRGACYWSPERRFTVFPYLQARTWTETDFRDPAQRRRLMECLGAVRALTPGTPRRSYTDYLDHYWRQLWSAGVADAELAARWWAFRAELVRFDRGDWHPVLTHHDLIPENVLETGGRIYLIDWEYAAVGHPDIDRWCIDPVLVHNSFIHELAQWTNDLWERVARLLERQSE